VSGSDHLTSPHSFGPVIDAPVVEEGKPNPNAVLLSVKRVWSYRLPTFLRPSFHGHVLPSPVHGSIYSHIRGVWPCSNSICLGEYRFTVILDGNVNLVLLTTIILKPNPGESRLLRLAESKAATVKQAERRARRFIDP
jgi:hypothetical protein